MAVECADSRDRGLESHQPRAIAGPAGTAAAALRAFRILRPRRFRPSAHVAPGAPPPARGYEGHVAQRKAGVHPPPDAGIMRTVPPTHGRRRKHAPILKSEPMYSNEQAKNVTFRTDERMTYGAMNYDGAFMYLIYAFTKSCQFF